MEQAAHQSSGDFPSTWSRRGQNPPLLEGDNTHILELKKYQIRYHHLSLQNCFSQSRSSRVLSNTIQVISEYQSAFWCVALKNDGPYLTEALHQRFLIFTTCVLIKILLPFLSDFHLGFWLENVLTSLQTSPLTRFCWHLMKRVFLSLY